MKEMRTYIITRTEIHLRGDYSDHLNSYLVASNELGVWMTAAEEAETDSLC
jgi:hypothetical protein